MPSARLTDRTVKAIQATGKRVEWWDQDQRGLLLRVSADGSKVWHVRYRTSEGRRRYRIGTYPEIGLAVAREEARNVLAKVQLGADPAIERHQDRQAETFAELAELYLSTKAETKKDGGAEDRRKLERDILPKWGKRRAKDITRADVRRLLKGIADRGAPIAANRTAALLGAVFSLAVVEGIVESHPALKIRFAVEKPRERVLTDDEIRGLWRAEIASPGVLCALRLALLTGQRRTEIASLKWSDIEGSWWSLEGVTTKNGNPHRVYLAPAALEVLEDARNVHFGGPWVFPATRGEGHVHPDTLTAAFDSLGFDGATLHDVRRTVSTRMNKAGIRGEDVEKVLNHKGRRTIATTYNRHDHDTELERALTTWAGVLARILDPTKGAEVVPIRGRA